MRSLLLLAGGSAAVWALAIYPAWNWWGEPALLHSAVAWGLCVLPALGTMAWVLWADPSPEMRTMAALGGTGIRMAIALGGGWLLTRQLPELFPKVFWIWVGGFYLFALTLEVVLLVRHYPNTPSVG